MQLKITKKLFWFPVLMLLALSGKYIAEDYVHNTVNLLAEDTEELVAESQFTYSLLHLKNEIGLIQNKVRGLVITEEKKFIYGLDSLFLVIPRSVKKVEKLVEGTDEDFSTQLATLELEINDMIAYKERILDTYYTHGSEAARVIIESQEGIRRRQTIFNIIDEIAAIHLSQLEDIAVLTKSDTNSALIIQKITALSSTIILAVISSFIFIYVIRQNRLNLLLQNAMSREKEAYSVRDQFITNMSHELRTPLNAVIGYSDQLKKTELTNKQEKFVRAISTSGETLLGTINYFLDFKKLEHEEKKLKKIDFSLPELVADLKLIFEDKCIDKNIRFETVVDNNIPKYLSSDLVRIKELLINLIGNAVKFTESGSVTLRVDQGSFASETKDLNIIFRVIDTGKGISKEDRDKIFDQFYQVESGLSRKHIGTGLGLAITKRHVESMKGKISVQSEIRKGSTFTVELPVKVSQALSLDNDGGECDMSWVTHERLLVVDDNNVNLDLVSHILEEWKFDVRIVTSGFTAMELLTKETFDLVLLDIQMPVLDGYTVLAEIRDTLRLDIPVIGLSAHSSSDEKDRALAKGMNGYLTKPFKENELAYVLEKHLRRPKQDSLLDFTYLRSISRGKAEFEIKMLTGVLPQFNDHITLLDHSFQSEDSRKIKKIIHELKPNLELVGVRKATLRLVTMISETVTSDLDHARQQYHDLKGTLCQLVQELKVYIEKHDQSTQDV